MIGQITPTVVVTNSDQKGKPKLAQPGNREWPTVIQGVNSQTWTVPPYIIVKGKYHLSSWYENSPLPKDWKIAVSNNRYLGLRGHQTTQPRLLLNQNLSNLESPDIKIVLRHQSDAIDQFSNGAHEIMRRMAVIQIEVTELREVNSIISKHRRAKKTRLWLGGSLNIQDIADLQDQKDVEQQVQQEMRQNGGGPGRCQARQRRCGVGGKPGNNALLNRDRIIWTRVFRIVLIDLQRCG